jgi:hypothetical protein
MEIMTISMYESSVGIFAPFLDNLSALLDHASDYAKSRNIASSVLLEMRLHPTMYSLSQQVGEANRHAVIGCALLAGRTLLLTFSVPQSFFTSRPPMTLCVMPASILPRRIFWERRRQL